MSPQLPLGIQLKQAFDFDSFVAGENLPLIDSLRRCVSGDGERFIYIWGGRGTGKTHLLQAACTLANNSDLPAIFLPLGDTGRLGPGVLEDLDQLALVCLDDLQDVVGHEVWETAIFRLFNALRERQASLVVTAQVPPARLTIGLADLASRLSWGPCFRIREPSDQTRLRVLVLGAQRRGLQLEEDTALYLLRRCRRDMHSLQRILDLLDQASMAAQRRLTLPFVREVLKLSEQDIR